MNARSGRHHKCQGLCRVPSVARIRLQGSRVMAPAPYQRRPSHGRQRGRTNHLTGGPACRRPASRRWHVPRCTGRACHVVWIVLAAVGRRRRDDAHRRGAGVQPVEQLAQRGDVLGRATSTGSGPAGRRPGASTSAATSPAATSPTSLTPGRHRCLRCHRRVHSGPSRRIPVRLAPQFGERGGFGPILADRSLVEDR